MICLKEKQTLTQEKIKLQREDEQPKHKIRAKVEHRFADIKTQMKQLTTSVIGLVRNSMSFTLTCLAANLRLLAQRQMNREWSWQDENTKKYQPQSLNNEPMELNIYSIGEYIFFKYLEF